MSLSEFELIEQVFKKHCKEMPDVTCGIGDDAAVIKVPPEMELVLSMDTLVAGVHFPFDTKPEDIGYKALAVNLSDIAAMGAEPCWVILSMTLPDADQLWLEKFMAGFAELANEHAVNLVGGDLSRGPLSITIAIHGLVPEGKGITRSGAKTGDLIYVTGTLGDAGLALKVLNEGLDIAKDHQTHIIDRLYRPSPRLTTGLALRDIASSAIDISDGLIADLAHILVASKVGATLNPELLPLSDAFAEFDPEEAWEIALTSGDDYELCFTVPPCMQETVENKLKSECSISCIGTIMQEKEMRWIRSDNTLFTPSGSGYLHF
ncbi:MAG: thiamine-phosphate kinase [Gammaproteobacteria bacterium]